MTEEWTACSKDGIAMLTGAEGSYVAGSMTGGLSWFTTSPKMRMKLRMRPHVKHQRIAAQLGAVGP